MKLFSDFVQLELAITDSKAKEFLSIEEMTGEVILYKSVDYEKRKQIRTVVELRDRSLKTVFDFALLVINVRDVNDNTPSLTYDVIQPASMKVILENFSSLEFLLQWMCPYR